jgi:hypothetical protein
MIGRLRGLDAPYMSAIQKAADSLPCIVYEFTSRVMRHLQLVWLTRSQWLVVSLIRGVGNSADSIDYTESYSNSPSSSW